MSKVKTTLGEMSHKDYKAMRDAYIVQHPEYRKLVDDKSSKDFSGPPSTAGALEFLAATKKHQEELHAIHLSLHDLWSQLSAEFDAKVKT